MFSLTERWLREENLGTFSHMITRAYALLQSDQRCLDEERSQACFILVDEFQDANFAQIKILAALAGDEGNIFVVGDPDQGIYRFRGASSAAFELFRRHFPAAKRVVLQKNRRSTTPILRTAFALINENPQVFADAPSGALAYRARHSNPRAKKKRRAKGNPCAASRLRLLRSKAGRPKGPNIVSVFHDLRHELRCKWSDFGILYRQHSHRDDLVRELAEADVPFVIENMDVTDTGEVRDLFACLNAVVSMGDDVSLFRVAALRLFDVDPQLLRSTMRTLARNAREGQAVPLASVLHEVNGGSAVLAVVHSARRGDLSSERERSAGARDHRGAFWTRHGFKHPAIRVQFCREQKRRSAH